MKKLLLVSIFITLTGFMSCRKNHAPIIIEIIADPDSIGPNESTSLSVDAEDADGDDIAITWSCAHGTFSSTGGQSVTWTAPNNPDNYTIYVTAEDEHGATDDGHVTIKVGMISLDRPIVSYEVHDNGAVFYLFWAAVSNAEGYYIYADGERIDSTTNNSYDATLPATIYEVSAYTGNIESEKDSIDCTPVITTNLTVWGNSDPNPGHPSGIGFTASGNCVPIAISVPTNWPEIDFYFNDASPTQGLIDLVSPGDHIPPYNYEENSSANAGLSDFHALKIADALTAYTTQTELLENTVYSLWLDPNANGWDNTVDHFGKMKVENIVGSVAPYMVEITVAYQLIPGLRWVVTQ